MVAMAQVAARMLGATSSRRCTPCKFENPWEATFCQVCGAIVGGVTCPQCDVLNLRDAHHCESCGHSFREWADIWESVAPAAPKVGVPSEGPSPTALIGFGAVLSLAAASYPWYLFGGFSTGPEQQATLFQLLAVGWTWFPGIPLLLIAISAVTSAAVSAVRDLQTVRPAVAVFAGFVTLLSSTWLGDGSAQMLTTGAILATIGGIVVMTAGVYARSLPETSTRAA